MQPAADNEQTRQKLSFARSAGNRSLGVVPLRDFVVPNVGNGRTVALAYRQSMSSEMPKRAANGVLGQFEVRTDQMWGLMLSTSHLRRRRNNRSAFRVVLREALLHALWQISSGLTCTVSHSRMAAFPTWSILRGQRKP